MEFPTLTGQVTSRRTHRAGTERNSIRITTFHPYPIHLRLIEEVSGRSESVQRDSFVPPSPIFRMLYPFFFGGRGKISDHYLFPFHQSVANRGHMEDCFFTYNGTEADIGMPLQCAHTQGRDHRHQVRIQVKVILDLSQAIGSPFPFPFPPWIYKGVAAGHSQVDSNRCWD